MKVLITGSDGMLAQDLIPVMGTAHETLALNANELDITSKRSVFDVLGNAGAEVVINCAAYSQVDQAESDPEKAFLVNAYGVQQLALACRKYDICLCHISTDYVFDGKAEKPYQPFDPPNPLGAYGLSKRAGETFVQSILSDYFLIRTSSLYGRHGNNFVKTMLRLAERNEHLRVVDDQYMSPTWTVNLAQGILKLIATGNYGNYHFTDTTDAGITWHEFAGSILGLRGIHRHIEAVSTEKFKRPAPRPPYSVLDTRLFTLCSGYHPLRWKESLERFLQTI